MKNILKTLAVLGIIWAIYTYQGPIFARLQPFVDQVLSTLGVKNAPCAKPIPYVLGTFDTQFGISKPYFLSALTDAEAIWEKPFGKQLFTYEAGATGTSVLKVNLIYDYRQQATAKLASLGITVADDKSSYDNLKLKFTTLESQFTTEKSAYETEVAYWNARGGAPQDKYLELQAKQQELNNLVDEINSLVVVLNRLADTLNISVAKYNTIGASRGESFEEGVYQSDGVNSEIDIYEFSSRAKLVRVLAHELGHALGLEHVNDPKAIMYKLNQGNNEVLTKADLDELKAKCKVN